MPSFRPCQISIDAALHHTARRVPETKKAEYQEMSQAQKEEQLVLAVVELYNCSRVMSRNLQVHCVRIRWELRFQVKFAEYKTTQDFKAKLRVGKCKKLSRRGSTYNQQGWDVSEGWKGKAGLDLRLHMIFNTISLHKKRRIY